MMVQNNLVTLEPKVGKRCDITDFGIRVSESGGWLIYKQKESENIINKTLKDKEKEDLEVRKLKREQRDYNLFKYIAIGSAVISLIALK